MEYKIGDIAKMFGTTNEGIRFFEKKGLIKGKRDSRGYRVYTKQNIFMLGQCLMYTQMGFSLKQAQELFSSEQISSVIKIFERQIQKKKLYVQKETALLSCLEERKAAIEHSFLNVGRVIIERIPGIYIYKSELPLGSDELNEKIYSPSMLNLTPMAFSGVYFDRVEDGQYTTPGKKCYYVNEKQAKKFDIELPPDALYCPSCICATLVINTGSTNAAEYDYLKTISTVLKAENLTPIGDIQVWHIFFSSTHNIQQRYCRIIVPIHPETLNQV